MARSERVLMDPTIFMRQYQWKSSEEREKYLWLHLDRRKMIAEFIHFFLLGVILFLYEKMRSFAASIFSIFVSYFF